MAADVAVTQIYSGPVEAAYHIAAALSALGISLKGDMADTPHRWVKALVEMTSGYYDRPELILKTFDQHGGDQFVILRDIPFTSLCEHHLLPFTGVCHIGYLPGTRIVGLSKLARLVDCFAARLQVQERLTQEIAEALESCLNTAATGVVIEAAHSCMACRGVRKPGASMVTSALLGRLRTKASMRAEFMALIGKRG